MVASEAHPFAKTGGLADVVGALSLALGRLGHRVTLVLPRYRGVEAGGPVGRFTVTLGGSTQDAECSEHRLAERVRAILVDAPPLFDREGVYGIGDRDYPDNARRFGFLARAALECAARAGERPSVFHAHDWQAGLVPAYLETLYASHPVLTGLPSVFTIHNLAYQGLFAADWLPALDLGWDVFTPDGLEFWGQVSLLKAGVTFSDLITTVSETYAEEIQTPEYGCGFDGILRRRAAALVGIVNGIDTETWDPAHDPYLPEPYGPERLAGKRSAKRAVLGAVDLPRSEEVLKRPLIGMISRLVDQKGLELLVELADVLPQLPATLLVLGTGEPQYEEFWRRMARAHPDRIAVRIAFDERLAHLIQGGADVLLMPSRFEPCGLNQMYALRYGTVPVVRAVGGLNDTVQDYDPTTRSGTGFRFRDYSPPALLQAIERALALYRKPQSWQALQRRGMKEDHSWGASAREYVRIYEKAIGSREPGTRNPGTRHPSPSTKHQARHQAPNTRHQEPLRGSRSLVPSL